MAKVFLSFDRQDLGIAESVAKKLRQNGHEVEVPTQLRGSDGAETASRQAITNADCALVIWTPRSIVNDHVIREAEFAENAGRYVSIVAEGAIVPIGFRRIQSAVHESDASMTVLARELERIDGHAQRDSPEVGRSIRRLYSNPRAFAARKLFLSHANEDKPRLTIVADTLLALGYELWVDRPTELSMVAKPKRGQLQGIQYGANWKDDIASAIRRCDIVVCFWSDDVLAQPRETLHYELYLALRENKLLQCLFDGFDGAKIPYPYAFMQSIALEPLSRARVNKGLSELTQTLARRPRAARK